MRYLIFAIVFCFACGNRKDGGAADATPSFQDLQIKRDRIVAQIPSIADKYGFISDKCDSATFTSSLAAFSTYTVDLHQIEPVPGKYVRNPESCYPDGSASETSLDVYLGVLHNIWSKQDKTALKRVIDYGNTHTWIMGQGPLDLTNIVALVPIIQDMRDKMSLKGDDDAIPALDGYRGDIAAMIVLLHGRVTGTINEAEFQTLNYLVTNFPENPLYQTIYHRFNDGDYSETVKAFTDYSDDISQLTETGVYGWGSAPKFFFLITATGIAEGR